MAKDFMIQQIKKEFGEREYFSRKELFDFYLQFEPELIESTFRWRIYALKNRKLLTAISREYFTLKYMPAFIPQIGAVERKLSKKITKQFPNLNHCIWSTNIVFEFMLHIPGKFISILQVEKSALEPVYAFLKEHKYQNVYIQPEEKEIERYIYETKTSLILQSLISKAPIQTANMVATITIEKMIVDLYCDKKLFNAFQGNELVHIIDSIYNRYSIDFTKLFSYARRRRKELDIKEFLSENTDIPKIICND